MQVPEPVQGTWEGVWKKQGDSLKVRIEFGHQSGGWVGSFGSEDLGVLDIQLHNIVVDQESVSYDAVGDFTTTRFKGVVAGDALYGSLEELPNQPGASNTPVKGTFELRRSRFVGRPYDVLPVKFSNGAVQLAGNLLVPKGGGTHPAMILVAGSMAQPRGAMMFIADYLARKGIVALAYDKRGVGDSTGDWKDASNEDLGRDASAGIDFLASQPNIDVDHIGIYGHSQGGMIAPFVAVTNPHVRFIISAGGYGAPQFEQDLARVSRLLSKSGFSEPDQKQALDVFTQFVQAAKTGNLLVRRAFLGSVKPYTGKEWFDWLSIPADDNYWWKLYPKMADFNPIPYWAKVSVPIFLMHGEQDDMCPVHPGLDRIVQVLSETGHQNVTVKIFPNADHSFRLIQTPSQVWPHIAPDFLDSLSKWVLALR